MRVASGLTRTVVLRVRCQNQRHGHPCSAGRFGVRNLPPPVGLRFAFVLAYCPGKNATRNEHPMRKPSSERALEEPGRSFGSERKERPPAQSSEIPVSRTHPCALPSGSRQFAPPNRPPGPILFPPGPEARRSPAAPEFGGNLFPTPLPTGLAFPGWLEKPIAGVPVVLSGCTRTLAASTRRISASPAIRRLYRCSAGPYDRPKRRRFSACRPGQDQGKRRREPAIF